MPPLTPTEAFEKWWTVYGAQPPSPDDPEESAKAAWQQATEVERARCAKHLEDYADANFKPYDSITNPRCGAGDRLPDHMQDICSCIEWNARFKQIAAAIRTGAAHDA